MLCDLQGLQLWTVQTCQLSSSIGNLLLLATLERKTHCIHKHTWFTPNMVVTITNIDCKFKKLSNVSQLHILDFAFCVARGDVNFWMIFYYYL